MKRKWLIKLTKSIFLIIGYGFLIKEAINFISFLIKGTQLNIKVLNLTIGIISICIGLIIKNYEKP